MRKLGVVIGTGWSFDPEQRLVTIRVASEDRHRIRVGMEVDVVPADASTKRGSFTLSVNGDRISVDVRGYTKVTNALRALVILAMPGHLKHTEKNLEIQDGYQQS